MTDKQIIIDGVDVKLFRTPLEVIDYLKQDAVRVVTKELFEQLKAKEQECEELNNIINEAKKCKLDLNSFLVGEAIQNEYEEQLDQLKAENEELKEQFKLAEPLYQACNIKDKKINKLKQAIEKVREVCQKDKDFCVSCEGDGNIDCIDCTEGGKAKLAVQILQKISEVENGI